MIRTLVPRITSLLITLATFQGCIQLPAEPEASPTASPAAADGSMRVPTPTPKASIPPVATSTPTPTPKPTSAPAATPAPKPTATPTAAPTATPNPSLAPGVMDPLAFQIIPISDNDLNAPGRGMEVWYNSNQISIPGGQNRLDKYYRFCWSQFEKGGQGVYDWSAFDREINNAIDNGQKFSFGMMTQYPTQSDPALVSFGGASSCYPEYVHALMQGETYKDWQMDGYWIPNWNSEGYLGSLEKFYKGLNNHTLTTSYKNIPYKNVVNRIDIRAYGHWGEWHLTYATGNEPIPRASAASLIRIIDAHLKGFPDFQLQALVSGYKGDGYSTYDDDTIPKEVSAYLLSARNNAGLIGWRWDSIGNTSPWFADYLENNPLVVAGVALKTEIMNRWKFAPVGGEGPGGEYGSGVQGYSQLETQIKRYGISSMGNGNYGITPNPAVIASASKAMGYRLVLNGGGLTSVVNSDRKLSVKLAWRNIGNAPSYEHWNVMFKLFDATGKLVWSGKSAQQLYLFLPATSDQVVTDTFSIPSGVSGKFTLKLSIEDPNAYRKPLPLAISGVQADGSSVLGQVAVP